VSRKVIDLIPPALKAKAKKLGRPNVDRSKGKYPWFKFWPDAWLSDSSLQSCSFIAKGLWIDTLAHIHKEAEGGSITRSVGQFARLYNLTNKDLIQIFDELAETGTAEVKYTRVHPETGEFLVDKPVDKFTEQVIKSNLSQMSQNDEVNSFANSVFVTLLSRRMKRDQIKRDDSRMRKRKSRDQD